MDQYSHAPMEVAFSLSEDVLLEMFSRLPKKPRLRCEAVSKNWQNLIGKTASSRNIARELESGFVGFDIRMVNFYRLDDKGAFNLQEPFVTTFKRNDICFIGSCNGFLFFLKEDGLLTRKQSYHLYNPVTRHLTTLPPPPLSDSPFLSGIGFAPDPDTNHYKFLVFYFPYPRETDSKGSLTLAVAIFKSETREWKTKRSISTAQLTKMNPLGNLLGPATLYCRGSLYWLLRESPCLSIFSMKTKTFRLLSLPEAQGRYGTAVLWESRYRGVLWESEGSFHYCQLCDNQGLCIWVLEENPAGSDPNINSTHANHTWRKIYRVDQTMSNMRFAQAIGPVPRVLGFNEHLQIVLLETSECLVWYDISAKRMSPVPPSNDLPALGMEYLSFTYNNTELPNINEPEYKPKYSENLEREQADV